MIRIECDHCRALFIMPRGASVGEMSAWMRWHAVDDNAAHTLTVHPVGDKVDGELRDVDHGELREAMQKCSDYDEGMRDAAQFVLGCLDAARKAHGHDVPAGARRMGAEALLGGVSWRVDREIERISMRAALREVSPEAETVREQADALDIGRPAPDVEEDPG